MRAAKRRKTTPISKIVKSPVSSAQARKLLWHDYRRTKSWKIVAEHFELKNSGLAYRIATGTKRDTPAIRVAVRRATARAARAFYNEQHKLNGEGDLRAKQLRSLMRQARDMLAKLETELFTVEALGL